MASEEVKQKLQRSILSRQSLKQAEAHDKREMAQISELDTSPHSPPSPQHRSQQLWRTASGFVLKHKQRRCSSSRKDPFHNSCRSSGNFPPCQFSPPSDQSDQTLQMSDNSIQLCHQTDRNTRFIGPLKMMIQAPVTVSHENMFCPPVIFLNRVYVDTVLFTSPHLAVMPEVCMKVMHHRPLVRCRSQPLSPRERPSGCHHCYSCQEPDRPLHRHHPEAEERTAGQERGKVKFVVGDDAKMIPQEEPCEGYGSTEWSSSSHLSPGNKLHRKPAVRIHTRSHQPLTHTLSSPPAYFHDTDDRTSGHAHRTGLVYDPQMLKQQCICGDSSCGDKHAWRIPKVFDRLRECGVSDQCEWITGRQCSVEHQQMLPQLSSLAFPGEDPPRVLRPEAVGTAAGCVTQLVLLVAQGRLRNGFAIVQPHGHEASHSSPSKSVVTLSAVAIATKELQRKHNNRRILILDWDDHHCKGTQEMFYTDPNVLLISLHRDGNTAHRAAAGRPDEVGRGEGKGFNINVEWSCDLGPPIGDAEYLAAFRTVIRPIAQEFRPDLILISTEFNTADGHPASQGGPRVSDKCFGLLTQCLMELSGGRVVVVLEGGHDVTAVCEASKACVSALLENQIASLSEDVLMKKPCTAAAQSLHRVLLIHSEFWSSMKALTDTVGESWLQAEGRHSAHNDTALALASLSMTTPNCTRSCCGGDEPVEHDEDEEAGPA